MARKASKPPHFNVVIVGQSGRLQYEAILFAASLRAMSPQFTGKLFIAEPQPGPRWEKDPRISSPDVRTLLETFDVSFLPFENRLFGQPYPEGNKIELLTALPKGEPFVFFDTDTLITGELMTVPFDFDRPSASLRVEGTWPQIELYGPGYAEIWQSLYDRFGLDMTPTLDLSQPDEYWRRYMYFNAGFFYFRCPHEFGMRFADFAQSIRNDPPPELVCQNMSPWLDQIALPLVIHSFGGGRDSLPKGYLDGKISCHYRVLPLLYAREDDHVVKVLEQVSAPNRIKKVLKQYDPFKRMIYQRRGHKVRALFDQDFLPRREQLIRNAIRKNGFWMR